MILTDNDNDDDNIIININYNNNDYLADKMHQPRVRCRKCAEATWVLRCRCLLNCGRDVDDSLTDSEWWCGGVTAAATRPRPLHSSIVISTTCSGISQVQRLPNIVRKTLFSDSCTMSFPADLDHQQLLLHSPRCNTVKQTTRTIARPFTHCF